MLICEVANLAGDHGDVDGGVMGGYPTRCAVIGPLAVGNKAEWTRLQYPCFVDSLRWFCFFLFPGPLADRFVSTFPR